MVKLLPPFGGGFEGEDPNDRIHTQKKQLLILLATARVRLLFVFKSYRFFFSS